ncbi:MAG TPA: cupredoxin domain-containing protein, partial [Actinomycetota bacterium]|nr:cupredoxin domain-containing protein [Actinomycetota bacterium]
MGRRLLLPLLGALPLALALAPSAAGGPPVETVRALDDVYDPEVLRVAPGTEVVWENVGRSPHTVTADDGGFDSGDLAPGGSFRLVFDEPGIYPYHCTYHGAPGVGMAGVVVVGDVPLPAPGGAVGPGREPVPTAPGPVLRVPRDFPTIQAAVDAARPGGLVLVSPGVYRESVRVTTPYVTIRGLDRNRVILDGGFRLANGIQVLEADGVVLENMTARHYLLNGFLWNGVRGYRGSYLTAYANGEYGIFAYDSVWGRIERSYASGHPDSGFYIGQCNPCHAVITDVLAEGNALGFSGTNAGGDLAIV